MLCAKLAETNCASTVEESCLKRARESYYLYDSMISDEAQACCVDAYAEICTTWYNETCKEVAKAICVKYSYLYMHYNLSYTACLEAESEMCLEEWKSFCTVNGSVICSNTSAPIWNDTAISCHHLTTTLYEVTLANCTSQQLPNCTSCMYDSLMRCEETSIGGDASSCTYEASVVNCSTSCMHERCEYEFHEVLVTYRFRNCSQLIAESFDVVSFRHLYCSPLVVKIIQCLADGHFGDG